MQMFVSSRKRASCVPDGLAGRVSITAPCAFAACPSCVPPASRPRATPPLGRSQFHSGSHLSLISQKAAPFMHLRGTHFATLLFSHSYMGMGVQCTPSLHEKA